MDELRKNAGQTGGRQNDAAEKGDIRRDHGGPGQQGHHGVSDREAASEARFGESQAEPLETVELRPRIKNNRDRHADKQQTEEAGPGRVSQTPPERGRY
jgi:hypothetical protein